MTVSFRTQDELLHHTNSTGQWLDFEKQPLSDLLRFLLEHMTVFEAFGPDAIYLEELPTECPEFTYNYSQLCMQNFYRMCIFYAWRRNCVGMVARDGLSDVPMPAPHIAPTPSLPATVQKTTDTKGNKKKSRVRPNPTIDQISASL